MWATDVYSNIVPGNPEDFKNGTIRRLRPGADQAKRKDNWGV